MRITNTERAGILEGAESQHQTKSVCHYCWELDGQAVVHSRSAIKATNTANKLDF